MKKSTREGLAARGRLRSRTLLALATSTLVVGVSAAQSSADQSSHERLGAATVKPDKAYFAGKTITIILGGTPGSTNYDAAQVLIPGMEAYLHATVVLNDNPNGNTISAENLAYAQPPNGLFIGYLGVTGALAADLLGQTSVNFALKHVENDIIAGSPQGNYVLVATASSGIKSMADLAALPVKVNLLDTSSGGGNAFVRTLVGLYPNLPITVLNGYSSTSTELAGLVRGDGALSLIPPPSLETYIPNGQLVPLLVQNKPPKGSVLYSYLSPLPTMAEYAAKHPVKGKAANAALAEDNLWDTYPTMMFFVPPTTPLKYQLALTAAMKYAASLPTTKAAQLADGVPNGLLTPAQVIPVIKQEVNNDGTLRQYLQA
jgi:hypothetical protein